MKKSGNVIIISFLLIMLHSSALPAAETVLLNNDSEKISLGNSIDTMEDVSGKFAVSLAASPDAPFIRSNSQIPNFGFTRSVYWVRFNLESSNAAGEWLLETGFPLLDRIDIYTDTNDGKGYLLVNTTGRDFPFSQRIIKHRNMVFPFSMQPGSRYSCLMRIKTDDGMIFPLTLWKKDAFMRKIQGENFLFGLYYGIIIVMFFYNLFLFVSIRDISYFFYILYIGFFGMFQISMNGLACQYLWSGSPWWTTHANPFFIGLSLVFAVIFSIRFLDTRKNTPVLDVILRILLVISFIQVAGALVLPYSLTILTGQLLPLACILTVTPAAIICLMKGNRSARFYLIAWSTFLAGIVLSTLRVMGLIPHNFLTEHGMQIGSAAETMLLSLALADRIKIMEKEKQDAQDQLIELKNREIDTLRRVKEKIEEANRRISLSEERYRLLVEGSNEVIFTLDENWNFISANAAIRTELNLDPQAISNKNFLDLLYNDTRNSVSRDLVREKLDNFAQDRKPVEFRAELRSPISIEPREMHVRLEYLNVHGKNEILGKAYQGTEDNLLRYFNKEELCYEIGNFLITADEITHRLTRNLKRFMDPRQVIMVRLALREMIINAIEHGNLGVSFEEKTDAIMNDRYFEFIANRQHDPMHANKKVRIEYKLDPASVTYTIQDEGEGFNHENIKTETNATANRDMLAHGRGITMARNVFDEVRYNESGNSVVLIKFLS